MKLDSLDLGAGLVAVAVAVALELELGGSGALTAGGINPFFFLPNEGTTLVDC